MLMALQGALDEAGRFSLEPRQVLRFHLWRSLPAISGRPAPLTADYAEREARPRERLMMGENLIESQISGEQVHRPVQVDPRLSTYQHPMLAKDNGTIRGTPRGPGPPQYNRWPSQ
ncbi:hypothetical protein SRHO_G00128660 [Serrasalmus rhombeus]